MKKLFNYVRDFYITVDKRILFFSALFVSAAVTINYSYNINGKLSALPQWLSFTGWYAVFVTCLLYGYLLVKLFKKEEFHPDRKFIVLLLIAPAIFAWKMTADVSFHFSADDFKNEYWNAVIYWPFKLVVMMAMLHLVHRFFHRGQGFYGLTMQQFYLKPYLLMLLLMVPLIAAASTQPDFLEMYPRLNNVEYLHQHNTGFEKLLYELSYGTDFLSIELYFRGFLVLGFAKWAGRNAILPMAIFYCVIHFGKPLGECISSFFGGMILGVVTYHTRSIIGGFMVHVGIAWLMEVGGYLGKLWLEA